MKSRLMALSIAGLVAWPLAGALAASPEEDYFAARDAFIEKFDAISKAGKIDDNQTFKEHDQALDELGRLTQQIVGPVAVKGFAPNGKSNLDSLFKGDDSFGVLDGLLFSSTDDKAQVVVTTVPLFEHWLREHKDWWEPPIANVPQEITAALKSDAFYTQALRTDAAFSIYAELPVAKPVQSKFAAAMLVARRQDFGLLAPKELLITSVQAPLVFVVSAPAHARIEIMTACQEIWRQAERKAAHPTASAKDADKARERLEEEGDAAMRRCFGQRAQSQKFFSPLTNQAQAWLDRLPAR
jgi:hypothetical protein